ncbi:MAG: hypothetical protein EBZ77_16880, partial [Chitinophagia bacterium]|nr:hypothetical protein [Chitinophagia bacterium]
MAFGFDDFAKFFDPISDVLGTSGRKGVGLLQQKPEDIAMTAAAMYLAANGVPVSPETLAAAEPLAAAGESAALVTPEVAAMAPSQVAAMTPGTSGIMEVGQLDPALVESINAPGIKTAGLGNLLETGYWETPVNLDPLTVSLNDVNGLDWSSQIGYEQAQSPAYQDLVNSQRTGYGNEGILDYSSQVDNIQAQSPAYQDYVSSQRTGYGREIPENAFDKGMRKAGEYFDKATDKLDKFSNWAEKHPYQAAGLGYYTAYKTGMLDQPKQEPIADNYKNPYSMANFQRSSPNPSAYQYRPRYPQYAQGGIASVHGYAKGGRSKAEMAMDFYNAMNPQQESAPLRHGDPGIYYDMDPDT